MKNRKAYSLIELMTAVSVIAIISTMVYVNYNNSKTRARDANRRDNVASYQKAIDQYYSNTGTYMIAPAIKNIYSIDETPTGCNYAGALTEEAYTKDYDPSVGVAGWERLNYALQGLGCSGYKGQGLGKITRSTGKYGAQSIASTLKNLGYITEVRTDPRAKTFNDDSEPDYVLTLCTKTFRQALSPVQAVNYALFASMENPARNVSEDEEQKAKKYCGGELTGRGWLDQYSDVLKINR